MSEISTSSGTLKRQLVLDAFAINVPGRLSPGLWHHPRDAGETGEFAVEESPTDLPPGQALQRPWAAYLRAVTSMDPILILDRY
jgi:hypothetical protein